MNLFRVILLFSVLPAGLYAGDTLVLRQKRLAIGLNLSPEICSRSATAFKTEAPILAFSAGGCLRWMRDNSVLSVGLQFSQKGWKNSESNGRGSNTALYEVRRQYNYIEVPFAVTVSSGTPGAKLIVQAGIAPAYLLYERRIKMFRDGHREKTPFNYIHDPFNLFLSLGIGAEFSTGKQSSLQILPRASYGVRPTIYYSGTGGEYLYSIGIQVCLNFNP